MNGNGFDYLSNKKSLYGGSGGGDEAVKETIIDDNGNSCVVFSNNFCIQCFKPFDSAPAITHSLTFLKPFRDTNYSANFNIVHQSGFSGGAPVEITDSRTVNGFKYYHKGGSQIQAIIMGFV